MPHRRGAVKARTELQEADTGTAPGAGDPYYYLVQESRIIKNEAMLRQKEAPMSPARQPNGSSQRSKTARQRPIGPTFQTARSAPRLSQEMLGEMIGTTRSRVSFFMNRFRKLGFIHYSGGLQVHSSLLNVVLHD